jgi:long-chain acyl-CoA synthetase
MRGVQAFTFGDLLRENARRFPTRTAVVCGGSRWTFPELRDAAFRFATVLRERGVGEGDRVVWFAQNCHRYLETLFGSAVLGAQFTPLNWRSSPAELQHLLADSAPRVVISQRREIGDVVDRARAAGAGGEATWLVVDDDGPNGYAAQCDGATSDDPGVDVDDEACVIRMYTAAFAGAPKGALLTHRGLIAQNLAQMIALGVSAEDAYLNTGPLFHIAGTMFLFSHLHAGAKNVMLPRVEGAEVARLIDAERITSAMILPPSIPDIVAAAQQHGYDLSSLRTGETTGTPELVEWSRMTSRGRAIVNGYGQTEACGLVSFTSLRAGGLGAHGRTSPVAQVRVVDPDGQDVAVGETGEIAVRGPLVMLGYAGEAPEGTRLAGWRLCNDLGRREADGTITFIGPKTELIKSAAENIYPTEVENALRAHAKVRDACVIGVADPVWGQSVKAVVEPVEGEQPTAEELIAWCRERIAAYKKPRVVEIVGRLPRTAAGAVDRDAVKTAHGGGGTVGAAERATARL